MTHKLFTLLIVTMILLTVSVLTLAVTGHEELVMRAGSWIAQSAASIAGTLGVVGLIVVWRECMRVTRDDSEAAMARLDDAEDGLRLSEAGLRLSIGKVSP